MISNLLANYLEAGAIILFGIGFTMLLFHRNLFKKLIGMNIMDTIMLSLTIRLYHRYHTLNLDDIYLLSLHETEDR